MTRIVKTAREWWLVIFSGILLFLVLYPIAGIELFPVLDWKGGNQFNMDTDKWVYHCGDQVRALFIVQKQRGVVGTVRWELISGNPDSHRDLYPSREAAAPVGIYRSYVDVEKLPAICQPGKYHFEGTITYPLLIGKVTYSVRTTCFTVAEDKK